ncbi:hypothetical protein STEG23_016833 [Scotinomys teguina]
MVHSFFADFYEPTVDYYWKRGMMGRKMILTCILDTGGGGGTTDEYHVQWDQSIRKRDSFLSLQDINSFEEVHRLWDVVPMVLVGNKCDVEAPSVDFHRVRDHALCYECPYVETLATTRHSVQAAFFLLVRSQGNQISKPQNLKYEDDGGILHRFSGEERILCLLWGVDNLTTERTPASSTNRGLLKQVVIDHETCLLPIVDTAGLDEYDFLRDQSIRTWDGFLIVFSLKDVSTFEVVHRFREKIKTLKDSDVVLMVLMGNKCDMEAPAVDSHQARDCALCYNCANVEMSTATRHSVEEAFFEIVREIRRYGLWEMNTPGLALTPGGGGDLNGNCPVGLLRYIVKTYSSHHTDLSLAYLELPQVCVYDILTDFDMLYLCDEAYLIIVGNICDVFLDQRPSSSTPEKSPCPHRYLSPLESRPSHLLGPRSTRTPSQYKEHPDAITPQGPRSTETPLQHKPPAGTQEHPDAIGLEGQRSTQTTLDQEDPGVTKRYWTKRTQKYLRHHWTRRSQKHP